MIDLLLDLMRQYGTVDTDVEESVREAVKNENYRFIFKHSREIGFYSWEDSGEKIYINNLLILPQYRAWGNLLHLRKFFKDNFPNKILKWGHKTKERIKIFR